MTLEQFAHPYLTVDVALLTVDGREIKVLLVPANPADFPNQLALPGKFVQKGEGLEEATTSLLHDKTGLDDIFIEQLYTFGDDPRRDPRGHVVTVVYYALVENDIFESSLERADLGTCVGTVVVPWSGSEGQPGTVIVVDDDGIQLDLAFDHRFILGTAINRIRAKLRYSAIGFELLKQPFTMSSLRRIHEALLDEPVQADSFRRRMLQTDQIRPTGDFDRSAPHRPAELFTTSDNQPDT